MKTTLTMTAEAAHEVTAKSKLREAILDVRESLTAAEAFFLHALLIDPDPTISELDQDSGNEATTEGDERRQKMERAAKVLSDDMLFSSLGDLRLTQESAPPKAKRPSILGLWKAHGHGVPPRELIRRSSSRCLPQDAGHHGSSESDVRDADDDTDGLSIPSEEELRPDKDDGELSDGSWDDDDHLEHFDTWNVLKDEYAADFGFSFDPHAQPTLDDDDEQNVFLILGTSADDASCQPHVLSPPMMDSLMSFVPMQLHNENYWLKFSLVRDGASLRTLKQYTRATAYTIIAIETTQGQVFGSFTSSPWRNTANGGFYGGPPAFVWKMRHGRRTKVASLFDQAQLESEIDVFMYCNEFTPQIEKSEKGNMSLCQICRHDFLAVGGDTRHVESDGASCDGNRLPQSHEEDDNSSGVALDRSGFALTLDADLLTGTTSPCSTFKSPALCGKGNATKTFTVSGLEVWTFTPARDVNLAERLEMTRFFVEQSSRNVSEADPSTSSLSSYNPSTFSSRDLSQREFYRRVGDELESGA